MKRFIVPLLASAVVMGFVINVRAQDAAAPTAPAVAAPEQKLVVPPPPPAPGVKQGKIATELKELNFTGKITKEETTDKKGATVTKYFMTDATGAKYALPKPQIHKNKKGEVVGTVINLDDYVDANVKLVAKGTTQTTKAGKVVTTVKAIESIEKVK